MPQEKKCPGCNIIKFIDLFTSQRKYCLDCHKEKGRQWRLNNKDKWRECLKNSQEKTRHPDYKKRAPKPKKDWIPRSTKGGHKRRSKELLRAVKSNSKCKRCGDANYEDLHFHHLRDKVAAVSHMVKWGYKVETIKKEMDKCIILCASCHAKEHHELKRAFVKESMKNKFKYYETEGAPLKLWDSHHPFDENAMVQLRNTAKLPFIYKHVAGMPDVHWGMGATIGSVVATKGAIVPACVGVDIGCGMMAVQTTLKASQLPDNLHEIRTSIENAVPHGRTNNGQKGDRGAWHNIPHDVEVIWNTIFAKQYELFLEKHPNAKAHNTANHLGTLGTGNHFIEVCLDEDQNVWVMLHSGSRGLGNKIGMYFIEKARIELEKYFVDKFLPDKDLSYLVEHTEIFEDYVAAVEFAQKYAAVNREIMMSNTFKALKEYLPEFSTTDVAVNCHHNYISKENHFNDNVWVTRKGAVRARKGDLGIIPGSMGTGSFIVEGLGNPESFHSCSHGAGRVMSRGEAKKKISMEAHADAMKGIEARLDADVIDESPAAYKEIGAVMEAQNDLVLIKHRLRQVINIKG